MTVAEFVAANSISAVAKRVDYDDTAYAALGVEDEGQSFWTVTLSRPGADAEAFAFFQGSAVKDVPTAEDLVLSMALDEQGVRQADDFADWAAEFGFEMRDLAAAQATWAFMADNTRRLRRLVGGVALEALLAEGVLE